MVEVTQLTVGGIKVGLIGLNSALAQVAGECLESDDEIADRLLALIGDANYITPSRTEDYRRALLREFKRRRGEAVPAESCELEILVLGAGCPSCHQLMSEVIAVLTDDKIAADLEHVREAKRIAEFTPLLTPALVINGKIVASGRVPRREEIVRWLKEASK